MEKPTEDSVGDGYKSGMDEILLQWEIFEEEEILFTQKVGIEYFDWMGYSN